MFDHLSNSSAVTPLTSIKENAMNDVTTFNFRSYNVRTILIDNEPWFVAKDVAEALGYKDPSMATRSHCKGVSKLHPLRTAEALRPLDGDKKITLSNSEGHSGQRGRALPRHAGYKSPYRARGYQPIQNWIG